VRHEGGPPINPFRSVGARLSLALAVVVAAALGIVYIALVPTLERRLVGAKVAQLKRAAPGLRQQLAADELAPEDFVTNAAASANARVVIFEPLTESPRALSVFADSLGGRNSSDVANDRIALAASMGDGPRSGTVDRGEERYAEAAVPVTPTGSVLLLTSSLHDTLAEVNLVQRRLIFAGVIALMASVGLGFGAASVFARRIRRLERAADRIAGGDFTEPVVDRGRDELGQLAQAFERMRGRLAQLDDARRAFIANASHELRTPLFSLGGFLELLQDEELDEETRREFLATMSEQVVRLTKLATDLLDLSRLDAGRLRVEREEVELGPLAQLLAEEFSAVARAGGHPLEAIVEEEAIALADPQRALQIGRVLLENALKHTPPETAVRLVVRAPAELTVEDDGLGIPPEQRAQVFERFTRLDGAHASGSGLGLAIARELAALMGGSIRLESEPGRTAFTLVLPVASAAPRDRVELPA
jgi:two-component system, OmpR family, sensor kinase